MWLRRAFYRWLFPAAIVLPLWLLTGWGLFRAGGWAFLWVLFIAIPSVFVGQLLLALLVRARPSVRASAAVSWLDVAGFSVWHVLVVFVGIFSERWFPFALSGAILAALGLFWLSIRQLRSELRDMGAAAGFPRPWQGPGAEAGPTPGGGSGRIRPGEVLIVTDVEPREPSGRGESPKPGAAGGTGEPGERSPHDPDRTRDDR
ncbi:MFS transporter permease [Leucobacter sp. CSA1]|uniref:MFS transporter permease n=1 Tax=Leucobacter chromiisoli TaxID=2796471 RepID=A0A934Q5W0_9MICO|nr:MFS transporter permease [Leucobacter chromiisoli]MBK0417955.1 MFS transporter permease [Leucobacter chromiisoli]